jgi:hypothetical protein
LESSDEIAEIELFLHRLHNGEFEFMPTEKQSEIIVNKGNEQVPAKTSPLSIYLDTKLQNFEDCTDEAEKRKIAYSCKSILRKMWLAGCIHEGRGLTRRIQQYELESEQLKRELAVVSSNLNRKIRQLEAIEKRFNLKSEDDFREGGK